MFAVAYLPQFPLQASLRHEPELWNKLVALTDPSHRPPSVCEATGAACNAGIVQGQTPTQAMARCATIVIRSRSPEQEEAAQNVLLQCAYGFSPHIESTFPGVCTLDLRGLATVNLADRAALENWAAKLQRCLAEVNLGARIGIGPTPHVARQAAQWGRGAASAPAQGDQLHGKRRPRPSPTPLSRTDCFIEIVENPAAFMAALPIASLEPSPDAALILQRWGVHSVGDFLALGQDALLSRLGLETMALFAASSTTALRPLHHTKPAERFVESFEFEQEIETLEPLLFLLRRFVDQLGHRLEWRGLVAETLVLQLKLESGQKTSSRMRLPQPTRQPGVLFRTLHTHLETVRTESPVRQASLSIVPVEAVQRQLGLFDTVLPNPQQFQETLARLVAVLGPDRVGTPALENSHRPDAFKLVPPDFEKEPPMRLEERALPMDPVPLRRFRPPLEANVECESDLTAPQTAEQSMQSNKRPAAKPVSIRCAICNGKLKIALGPWHSSGNWWEAGGWDREEWDAITTDGKILRLVHQAQGWFVEGVVD